MKQRIITALIMAIVLVPIVFIGGIAMVILTAILAFIGTYELIKMFSTSTPELTRYRYVVPVLSSVGALAGHYQVITGYNLLMPYFVIVFIVIAMIPVIKHERPAAIIFYLLFSFFYGGVAIALATSNRFLDDGLKKFIYIILTVIITDTFAYFIGITWGRHKLSPTISPKKSIEGAIGGSVFGTIVASLYVFIFDVTLFGTLDGALKIIIVIISTFLLTIVVQIGDLVASKLKRAYNIKDFGNLFPGHGGVMDRFDSLIFAGMTFYVVHSLIEIVQVLL